MIPLEKLKQLRYKRVLPFKFKVNYEVITLYKHSFWSVYPRTSI